MSKKKNSLLKQLEESDPIQVETYLKLMDRILIYNMAANLLPDEAIDKLVALWEKATINNINEECLKRTEDIETTKNGRLAKYRNEPDGEDFRLFYMKNWNVAKEVVDANLRNPEIRKNKNGFGEFDTDPEDI